MWIITAVRDFAEGLARGLSLFVMERRDYDECLTLPEAGWVKVLHPRQDRAGGPPGAGRGGDRFTMSISSRHEQNSFLAHIRKKVKARISLPAG